MILAPTRDSQIFKGGADLWLDEIFVDGMCRYGYFGPSARSSSFRRVDGVAGFERHYDDCMAYFR